MTNEINNLTFAIYCKAHTVWGPLNVCFDPSHYLLDFDNSQVNGPKIKVVKRKCCKVVSQSRTCPALAFVYLSQCKLKKNIIVLP